MNTLSKKMGITIVTASLLVPSLTYTAENIAEASSKKVACESGYTCYKITSYVTPTKTKAMSKQIKSLNTISTITDFIGLSGLTAGIVAMTFGSAVAAQQVFISAAKQGKGVQISYTTHISNFTTDVYNTGTKYTIK